MAPVTRTAPKNVTAPSTGPVTTERLGQLSRAVDDASAKVSERSAMLEKAKVALTQHPEKKQELQVLIARLAGEVTTAKTALATAQKQLGGAMDQVAGSRDAQTQVKAVDARLKNSGPELVAAKRDRETASRQLTADVANADALAKKHGAASPKAAAALATANKSQRAAEAAATKVTNLESAQAALTAEVQKRQGKALDAAQRANVDGAGQFADVVDLANAKPEVQVSLTGAEVSGVSRQAAAKADAARVTQAAKGAPTAAEAAVRTAAELKRQLASATPDGQDLMVAELNKTSVLRDAGAAAATDPSASLAVIDAVNTAKGLARTAITNEVAKSVTSMDSQLLKTLDAQMKDGRSFETADELESSLRKAGKTGLADQLYTLRTKRLGDITSAFDEQSKKIERVQTDLARLSVGFGQAMDAPQLQEAIKAFEAQHKDEFAAFEKAGAKLANAANFVGERPGFNPRARELMPEALSTDHGMQLLIDASRLQNKGISTFLDNPAYQGKDGAKVSTNLATAYVKAIGITATAQYAAKDYAGMRETLKGLTKNASMLGMHQTDTAKAVFALESMLEAGAKASGPGASEMAKLQLKHATSDLKGELNRISPSSPGYSLIKGLGVAFSAAVAVDKMSKADVFNQVKGTAELLNAGADAGVLSLEVLTRGRAAAQLAGGANATDVFARTALHDGLALTKFVGGAAQAVGAVMEGISAAGAFSRREILEGVGYSASALGGGILATATLSAAAGMQVVPVWGQVAGGLLIAGGTIAKWVSESRKAGKREDAMEADAKAFLIGGGIDPKLAEKLSDIVRADGRNVGMMVNELAPKLNLTPKALFEKLAKLPPSEVEKFVDMTKGLELDEKFHVRATSHSPLDSATIRTEHVRDEGKHLATHEYYPRSLPTAEQWTRTFFAANRQPL